MNGQIKEIDERKLSHRGNLSMGEDHARRGGSARIALERGTNTYKIGFAEQWFSLMQTASRAILSDGEKKLIEDYLEAGEINNALVAIAKIQGEEVN